MSVLVGQSNECNSPTLYVTTSHVYLRIKATTILRRREDRALAKDASSLAPAR